MNYKQGNDLGFEQARVKQNTIPRNNGRKKICLITDSIGGRINMKDFNKELKEGYVYRKKYPGQTPKEIAHNSQYTLGNDKPDTCIINVGTNNISKNSPSEIVAHIMEIVSQTWCERRLYIGNYV